MWSGPHAYRRPNVMISSTILPLFLVETFAQFVLGLFQVFLIVGANKISLLPYINPRTTVSHVISLFFSVCFSSGSRDYLMRFFGLSGLSLHQRQGL